MNQSTPVPVQTTTLSEEEFKTRLAELCTTFGLSQFSIYGRFNEPPTEGLSAYKYCLYSQGERTVDEEAGYYFTLLSEKKRAAEEKQRLEQSKAGRRKKKAA